MVTLNRWAHDPIFTQGDVSILLLTENLADLSPKIVASPSTVKVPIPIPDTNVRTQFLQFLERKDKLILENRLTAEAMGKITSGLNLLNLNQIAAESYQEDVPISMDYLKTKKKEIIENEAGGLLEFIESEFDLGMVSGHDFVKNALSPPPGPSSRAGWTSSLWATWWPARWARGKALWSQPLREKSVSPW
jgi:hypothetical protein